MKYIRTKEGNIYERLFIDGCLNRGISVIIDGIILPFGEEVIDESDSIEELCDEFVIKGTRGLYLGIPLQECELRNIPITQIYGAIWTDKGLIYVAKMNEKGELELLW